ncbi:MAG: RrF2 family transcriptional regulator [Candidatus Ornithomonoglobus sp.]
MKITREADYALRIVAELARSGRQIEAKTIAEQNDIPYRFTLKILRKLVQAGYLKSYRGVNGGYALDKPAEEITLKNIIEVIDGQIALNICLSGDCCANSVECRVKNKLAVIQKNLIDELDSVTFKDIIDV